MLRLDFLVCKSRYCLITDVLDGVFQEIADIATLINRIEQLLLYNSRNTNFSLTQLVYGCFLLLD
ncbi:MAG: hypothetical protein ACHBN1_06325 [Heteroscytonema crispum UTEX LB 1556]